MQMKTKLLNGTWNLKILGKDAGLTGEAGLPAEVPGSVYATLLTEGKIEDPYYRDNELKTLPIMDNDFCYTTRFEVEPEWFSMDGLFLRFDGIDTLADIYVNRQLLGSAYNMHRSWEYDLLDGDLLKEGTNELQVIIPVVRMRQWRDFLIFVRHTACLAGTGGRVFRTQEFTVRYR